MHFLNWGEEKHISKSLSIKNQLFNYYTFIPLQSKTDP